MIFTRRDLMKAGAAAAALAAIPRPVRAFADPHRPAAAAVVADPRVKELAMRAVDAARAAGAAYADVRLTSIRSRIFQPLNLGAAETARMHVGVRALVNGYWGFASSAYWTPDEVARVAREATGLARTNALGKPRVVELAPVPPVSDGHWEMPVELDPFAVAPEEILDFGNGVAEYAKRRHGVLMLFSKMEFDFHRQEKAFASSDGSYLTQSFFRTGAAIEFPFGDIGQYTLTRTPAGLGWEYLVRMPYVELITRGREELAEIARLPVKPVEVGRYDVVFDAASVAALLDGTIGAATELDRAMGLEANAGGTSYLNDPLAMLGSHEVGAKLVTVTANRSQAGALATAKWDDEGVEPDEATLVDAGILADFQTTRESAGWLAEWYAKAGRPVRSHGCAGAPTAGDPTMLHRPNLALAPGAQAAGFDDLVKATPRGVAMRGLKVRGDFNSVGGTGSGEAFEIRDGKRVARLKGAGFLFRAPELWKSVQAIGGAGSQLWFGLPSTKGEPSQESWHSVGAVPAAVKQLTVIDTARKA